MASGPIGKLTYFNVMAKGLPLTCVLESSGAAYDGEICSNWPELKATGVAPFGQLPLFQFDGTVVGQCVAIVQCIGRKAGNGGSTEQEKIKSDMLLAEAEDLYGLLQKNVDTSYAKDKLSKEEALKFWTEDARGTLPNHFANLEKHLAKHDARPLAGEAYLFGMFYQMSLCKPDFLDAAKFPSLSAWYTTLLASPAMQKVINGETPMGKFNQYFQTL